MDNKLLSIRAYLIEAKYYLGESNSKRALDYLEDALGILEGRKLGDFEEGFLNEYEKEFGGN